MTDDQIEIVARAIARSHEREYEMDDPDFKAIYMKEAQAAIEAMQGREKILTEVLSRMIEEFNPDNPRGNRRDAGAQLVIKKAKEVLTPPKKG